jgi:hypothetical protein
VQAVQAVTGYVAVTGVGADAASLPVGHPKAGVFGYDRKTKLKEITDGTSNTAILLEVGPSAGPWARGGYATARELDLAAGGYVGPGFAFAAPHKPSDSWFQKTEYGLNLGLADGSVRFVKQAISPHLLEALATAAGGEPVPEDW